MNTSVASKWSKQFDGEISENEIRVKFPSDKYRVSVFTYPAGTKFPGSMRKGVCFVLEGKCVYSFENFAVDLSNSRPSLKPI